MTFMLSALYIFLRLFPHLQKNPLEWTELETFSTGLKFLFFLKPGRSLIPFQYLNAISLCQFFPQRRDNSAIIRKSLAKSLKMKQSFLQTKSNAHLHAFR